MSKKINTKKGFTIVEIIVAFTIFSIMMVAFLSLFLTSLKITLSAGDKDLTVAEVSGQIEKDIEKRQYIDTDNINAIVNFSGGTKTVPTNKSSRTDSTEDGI